MILLHFFATISLCWFSLIENNENTCLSIEEAKLYKIIMEYRKSNKLNAIPFSAKLTKVAQAHVKDLATHYDFDQREICNPHSWSESGDWTPCCYTNDHSQAKCMWQKPKEIANYNSDGYEIAYYFSSGATADSALEGWKKSKGHNPLLINTGMWKKVEWKAIGIGIYKEYAVVWFGRIEDKSEMVICE